MCLLFFARCYRDAWGSDGRGPREQLSSFRSPGADAKLPSTVFTSSLLAALGDLSAIAPDVIIPYVPILLPQFVDAVLQVGEMRTSVSV